MFRHTVSPDLWIMGDHGVHPMDLHGRVGGDEMFVLDLIMDQEVDLGLLAASRGMIFLPLKRPE